MRSPELKVISILMLVLVVIALPSSLSMVALSAQSASNTSTEVIKLHLKAQFCKSMLQSLLLVVNISANERVEIEKLLSVNISLLKSEDLEKYVEKLCGYIEKLRNRIELRNVVRVEKVVQNISHRLAVRLQHELRKLNLTNATVLQLVKKLEQMKNFHELHGVLAKLRRIYIPKVVHRFGNLTSSFVDQMLVRIENRGSEHALRIALMEIDKALLALNVTLERLKLANASEKAIEAVERVITKLSIVKNILDEVRKEIKNITAPHVELKIMLRTMLRERVGLLTNETNATVHAMVKELQKLRQIAIKLGKHKLAKEINETIEKLLELSTPSIVNATNISIKQALAVLVRAEALLHKAYAVAEKALKERDIAKIVSSEAKEIAKRALELLSEIEKLKATAIKLRAEILKERAPLVMTAVSRIWVDLARAEMFAKKAIREAEKGDVVVARVALIAAEKLVKEAKKLIEKLEDVLKKAVPPLPRPSPELNKTVTELREQIKAMIEELEKLKATGLPKRVRTEIESMIMELRELLEKLSFNVTSKLVVTVNQQLEGLRIRVEDIMAKVEKVRELQKELRECEEKLAKLEKAVKAIEEKAKKLSEENPEVQKMLDEVKNAISVLKIEIHRVRVSIEEVRLDIAKMGVKHVTELLDQLEELIKTLEQLVSSLAETSVTITTTPSMPTPTPSSETPKP